MWTETERRRRKRTNGQASKQAPSRCQRLMPNPNECVCECVCGSRTVRSLSILIVAPSSTTAVENTQREMYRFNVCAFCVSSILEHYLSFPPLSPCLGHSMRWENLKFMHANTLAAFWPNAVELFWIFFATIPIGKIGYLLVNNVKFSLSLSLSRSGSSVTVFHKDNASVRARIEFLCL